MILKFQPQISDLFLRNFSDNIGLKNFWAQEEIPEAPESNFYRRFMRVIAVIHLHLQLIALILLHLRHWGAAGS